MATAAGSTRQGGSGRGARGARARRPRAPVQVAGRLPVARVAVDVSLAHLDRPFDYLVPARMSEAAVPGCRVRVRFAGQLMDGYLLDRAAASDHPGRLMPLERVVSPEPVLRPEIAAIAREVADRYAGTLADVLRLAIPPRHAGAEARPMAVTAGAGGLARPAPGQWSRYPAGEAFLGALADGRAPRAVWTALPGPGW
ncbi:MAG TPA: primosome assembly protein PriA, partial [Streptosporangiaceae bacterium]|nr:primosome assembly protein PriA [Streptosporangiaceae bacterium]